MITKSVKSYLMDEDALEVEQILFIVVGLIVAIGIGWFLYNQIQTWAKKGSETTQNANQNGAQKDISKSSTLFGNK